MPTTRPFARYTGGGTPSGTERYGDILVGIDETNPYNSNYSGVKWWSGPDEDSGYIIAQSVSDNSQPTNVINPAPDGEMTLSSTYRGIDIVLTNNDQTAYQQFGYQQSVLANTIINPSDKVMFSILVSLAQPLTLTDSHFIGVGRKSMNYQTQYGAHPGNDNQSVGYCSDGTIWWNGNLFTTGLTLATWGNGDVIDVAIDNNANCMWVRVNGGLWNNNVGADPTTNALGIEIIIGPFYPVLCPGYEGTMTIQNTANNIPSGYTLLGTNVSASVGFFSTLNFVDSDFLQLVEVVTGYVPSSGTDAKNWLENNGYWTSYIDIATSVLSLDAADYTSGDWIDSVGGKSFVLYNSPTWSSSNGGYFNFDTSLSQSVRCSTSLPSLGTWSVAVWHYYDGTNTGGAPCIVTETFIGGSINYSLGKNLAPFSVGFFNGSWRITDGYSLTPNNWYYIVGTYDGSTIKLYVNNTLVDSTNYTGTPTSSGAGIRLMERWDLSDYWGGRLATVDIYDKALGNSEIESIWNLTKSRFGL
jgi:hypothetical protein